MKNKIIKDGVVCISDKVVYKCPLDKDDDYKNVILGLFKNDYDMRLKNIFTFNTIGKKVNASSEVEAGKLATDYGYAIFEYKEDSAVVFLPETFNDYQFGKIVDEIVSRGNLDLLLCYYNNNSFEFTSRDTLQLVLDVYYNIVHNIPADPFQSKKKVKLKRN